ncbi:MAG: hypothetical protein LUM44_17950 [Pyrinomonadaceae bacterium]|nr:hypothetical protein [Pyrinomonadaceae bacterium]
MKRQLWFLLVLSCFFASISNAQNTSQNTSPTINLSKYELKISTEKISEAESVEQMYVSVRVDGVSEKVKNSDYKYTVSGGQIVGEGNNVQWNLFGVKPGTYTINLEITEKGKISTANRSITLVDEMINCGLVECPVVSVSASDDFVKIGESVVFTANVSGGNLEVKGYAWTISSGVIVKGQGTSQITIKPDPESDSKSITATVEINLLENKTCPNVTSETIQVKENN